MLNFKNFSQFNPEALEINKIQEDTESEIKERRQGEIEKINRETESAKSYWENYDEYSTVQEMINNIIASNQEGIYLYETRSSNKEQEERINHVLWFYNNPEQEASSYKEIPAQKWESLSSKPEIIEKVNVSLIQTYKRAMNFYDWKYKPKGFVIDGSKDSNIGAGNIAGIKIGYQKIEPLIKAIEQGDEKEAEKQQKQIADCLVYELTRIEKDEGMVSFVETERR